MERTIAEMIPDMAPQKDAISFLSKPYTRTRIIKVIIATATRPTRIGLKPFKKRGTRIFHKTRIVITV